MANVPTTKIDAANEAILTPSTTYYLSLHDQNPGTTGLHELGVDTGATRKAITFASSSGGTQASADTQTWTSNAVGGRTYAFFGIWDHLTDTGAAHFMRGGALSPSITPTVGSTVTAATGQITFTGN